jgi:hypothetical protein
MREGMGQALADLKVGLNDIADALKAGGRAASDEMAKAVGQHDPIGMSLGEEFDGKERDRRGMLG